MSVFPVNRNEAEWREDNANRKTRAYIINNLCYREFRANYEYRNAENTLIDGCDYRFTSTPLYYEHHIEEIENEIKQRIVEDITGQGKNATAFKRFVKFDIAVGTAYTRYICTHIRKSLAPDKIEKKSLSERLFRSK